MAAEAFTMPARATDSSGRVYPGAKAYFYDEGTLTARAVYSDSDLTNSLGAVVEADSGGWFPNIYFDGSYQYRCICTNSTGSVTIFDRDPINNAVAGAILDIATDATAAAASAAAAEASAATAAAATGSKTANTTALISAIRTNGFFPQPSWRTAANDVATITVPGGDSLTSSFGGVNLAPESAVGKLNWLSGPAISASGGSRAVRGAYLAGNPNNRSANYMTYEFINTSDKFEHVILCGGQPLQPGVNFRVLVGGKIAGTASLPTDGTNKCVLVQFPTSATRTIRVEVWGGGTYGIYATSAGAVSQTGKSYPLVSIISDSFGEASGTDPWDGEVVNLGRAIGANMNIAAIGGTGLMNDAAGAKTTWQNAERLKDLALNGVTDTITGAASPAPHLGIVTLSVNDNGMGPTVWGGAANYKEAVKKAMWVLIDHWTTNCPGKPLVFFGPTWPAENPPPDMHRMEVAAREVCAGQSDIWYISRFGPGPILRKGTGSKTTTTGNTTSGSKIITGIASLSGVIVGSAISGTGIPTGARVASIDSGTQVTIDINCTANGTGVALIFANDMAAMHTTDADTTHPNADGHNLDGLWMAEQLTDLIMNKFA